MRRLPTGAGGGSHAPLRCTKHLCTLGERAQLDSRPCCRCESAVCRPAWAHERRSGGCAGVRRAREVVCTLPSDAHTICAPWGRWRNLIRALAVGANRPCVALPGRVSGGQEVAPAWRRPREVVRTLPSDAHTIRAALVWHRSTPLHAAPCSPRAIDLSCCGHLGLAFFCAAISWKRNQLKKSPRKTKMKLLLWGSNP